MSRWLRRNEDEDFYLSVVTVLELERGRLLLSRYDPTQAERLGVWIDEVVDVEFRHVILDVDVVIARRCAALHIPNPRPDRDALIAATALVHDMTVVTRNVRDFAGTGVRLVDPWQP